MSDVTRNADGFEVDARLLSATFGLTEREIKARMRDGRITTLSEKGEGEDEGRWRMTFYHGTQALRLTVDKDGNLLSRSTFPVAARAQPASGKE
ncbi:DUF6522 family protein [Seohaeicola zhoushanensis]|nr:DUF6522 family protein [Seohaeicola zhoushanensis]